MEVSHPRAERDASPAAVTVGTDTYPVDDAGVIDCPDERAHEVAERLAEVYGLEPDDLVREEDGPPDGDVEYCDAIKTTDGEVCGRELPCPYHNDEEG